MADIFPLILLVLFGVFIGWQLKTLDYKPVMKIGQKVIHFTLEHGDAWECDCEFCKEVIYK